MADLFSKNAFNVLGLESSASQKDINKRAKELSNLLKIDEVPDYDNDLPFIPPVRTEGSVKTALQNLTSPTKRLTDYFFWFDSSNADEVDFRKLTKKETTDVVSKWLEASHAETAKGYIAKRNLAVLLSILAENSKSQIGRGLNAWESLISSDKFWLSFAKIYQLSDEVGTSDEAIGKLRENVIGVLSDYYADLSKEKGDNSYVSEFQRIFKVKGAKVEKDLLGPIYETINNASTKLQNIKIDDEKVISKQKLAQLRGLVRTLQSSFEKLKSLGYYNDSQSKAMRDKAAEAMRSVALDLYNNLNEAAKSGGIIKIAIEICGTVALKSRLEDDLKDLRKNVSHDKVVTPINELLEAEDYETALEEIQDAKTRYKNDNELQVFLINRQKQCVTGISVGQLNRGKELYEKNRFGEAKTLLNSTIEFILSYIDETDIRREYVDNILAEINRLASLLGKDQRNGQAIDDLRNNVVAQAKESFREDQYEWAIVTILIDAAVYAKLAEKVPELKRKKTVNSIIGWIIVIGIIWAISAASGGSSSNNSSSNSGSSGASSGSQTPAQQQACAQAASIKSQVDQLNSEMSADQSAGNTDAYNALVPQQNSLVNQYNALLPTCNGTGQ